MLVVHLLTWMSVLPECHALLEMVVLDVPAAVVLKGDLSASRQSSSGSGMNQKGASQKDEALNMLPVLLLLLALLQKSGSSLAPNAWLPDSSQLECWPFAAEPAVWISAAHSLRGFAGSLTPCPVQAAEPVSATIAAEAVHAWSPPGFFKTVNEALLGVDALPVQAALPGFRALSAVQASAGPFDWLLTLLVRMAVLQGSWVFADLLPVPAVLTLTLLVALLLFEVVLWVAEAGIEMLLDLPWKLWPWAGPVLLKMLGSLKPSFTQFPPECASCEQEGLTGAVCWGWVWRAFGL